MNDRPPPPSLLECHHEFHASAWHLRAKNGDEVYCRRCNALRIVVGEPKVWRVACRSKRCLRHSYRADSGQARRTGMAHAEKYAHIVDLIHDEKVVATFKPTTPFIPELAEGAKFRHVKQGYKTDAVRASLRKKDFSSEDMEGDDIPF